MSLSLCSRSACQLVAEMASGDLSAVDVLEDCRQRVEAVNPSLNALVVDRWDEARQEASRADQLRQAGERLGPLHGLPISIKEMFDVAGLPTTAGIRQLRSRRVTRDADAVGRLRAAGAIVIGKTNVPQMGMMAETDNPVYGRTNNPWNLDRGPGGSSGGEAALIAAGASPLGLGSDGAGSIRLPAHVCGICGFKPTGGRLSMAGHWLSANWPADWSQPGPMARRVEDLQLAYDVLSRAPGVAAYGYVPELPGDADAHAQGTLRVGVYDELPELAVMPAVARAVREAADALRALGVDVVPFRFQRSGAIWDLFTAIFYAEGLRDMKRQTRGSPVDPRVRQYFHFTRLPGSMRSSVARACRALGQRRVANTLRILRRPVLSADDYCGRLVQVQALRFHFARRLQRERIDALLGPAGPVPAFRHQEFYANYSLIYTGIANLLGLPAGVIPATRVRPEEAPEEPRPRDWVDQAMWRSRRDSAGLPIGVQIIGAWWSDRRVLALMQMLQGQLGQSAEYPHGPAGPDEGWLGGSPRRDRDRG